jgi:hypothetical protein
MVRGVKAIPVDEGREQHPDEEFALYAFHSWKPL